MKNWDKICRELSSGEDSDEGDSLNLQSVQRNARRVAELMQDVVFQGAPPPPGAPPTTSGAPMGTSGPAFASLIRDGLSDATHAASPRSRAQSTVPPAAAAAPVPPAVPLPADAAKGVAAAAVAP